MTILWIVLGVLAIIVLWVIMVYNGLIHLKVRCEEAWSDIDVQLKRRYDLIPNLIETVKGYASHEKELFTRVTEARAAAMSAGSVADKAAKENMLSDTLKSLFAVSENYPQLKTSDNFLQLQRELTDTEDKVAYSRRFYNGNVRDFNIKIQVFPNNLIAGMLHFEKKDLFEIAEAEKAAPKVKF